MMPRFLSFSFALLFSLSAGFAGTGDSASRSVPSLLVSRGVMVDSRDGAKYLTVTVGAQTWMARNLAWKADSSWCYAKDTGYCSRYGRLYTWAAAKTACPRGWRLPADTEWVALLSAVGGVDGGGNRLKSTSGWDVNGNGSDTIGFGALPGGNRLRDGSFMNVEAYANFWTATEIGGGTAYGRFLFCRIPSMPRNGSQESSAFSVRCVQDR
jgi:uncharacterized protein (TIGR02145 family)